MLGLLHRFPSGSSDDRQMIRLANSPYSLLITNDNFRDHIRNAIITQQFVDQRTIKYFTLQRTDQMCKYCTWRCKQLHTHTDIITNNTSNTTDSTNTAFSASQHTINAATLDSKLQKYLLRSNQCGKQLHIVIVGFHW